MMVHEAPVLQDDAISSRLLIASGVALRPDFRGELDESRLIGRVKDEFGNEDKLAVRSFVVREFDLKKFEAPRSAARASFVVERLEGAHTQGDLWRLDVALLRDSAPALIARRFRRRGGAGELSHLARSRADDMAVAAPRSQSAVLNRLGSRCVS